MRIMGVCFLKWRGRRLRWHERAQTGFALLEVIVSLAVTLVLIGGLLNLLLLGINNVAQGGGRTAACIYASSLLEEMKACPELLAGVTGAGPISADSIPFSQDPPPGVSARIERKPLGGAPGLYIVNVKVLTTGGAYKWEECLVGVVPAP